MIAHVKHIHPPKGSVANGIVEDAATATKAAQNTRGGYQAVPQAAQGVSYPISQPSLLTQVADRGVGVVGGLGTVAGMTMMAPMATGVVGVVTGAGAKLTKSSRLSRWDDKVKGVSTSLSEGTMSEFAGKVSPKLASKLEGKPLGNMKALNTVAHAGFMTGNAVSIYGIARDFSSQVDSLKQMEADITGKDAGSISTNQLLFGSVSEPVKAERARLIKTRGTHTLSEIAGLGVNWKFLKNPDAFGHGKFGMVAGMAAFMLPDMIAQAVDGFSGESVAPIYQGMSAAQKRGEKLPPEAYAEFLMTASKDLQDRGMTGRKFAEAVAQQYAAENASVASVIQEVHNGGLKKRIDAVMASQPTSHVDKLQGKGAAVAAPVVGAHTQKLAAKAQASQDQNGPMLH